MIIDSPRNSYLKFSNKTSPDEKIRNPSLSNRQERTKLNLKNSKDYFKTTNIFPRLDSSSEYMKTNLSTRILKNYGHFFSKFFIFSKNFFLSFFSFG